MQNYNQPAYERPGSATSFVGLPPPPPPGAPYQQQQQQQQQQGPVAPGYHPGTYGVVSGGYAQSPQQYAPPPQHDAPPPPPPKPYGFAAAVQKQNEQNAHYAHPHTGFVPQPQHGGYPAYTNAVPPPSATPYTAPSFSGHSQQAYTSSHTNPAPGAYVPPLGYHAQQPLLQQPPPLPPRHGSQGAPSPQPYQHSAQQPQGQYYQQAQIQQQAQDSQPTHDQYLQQLQLQQQQPYPQPPPHLGQLGQTVQPLQQQYGQPPVPQAYIQQQAAQLEQYAQTHQQQQSQQHMQTPVQSHSQWQVPPLAPHNYTPQETYQPVYGYQQQYIQAVPQVQSQQPSSGQPHYSMPVQATQPLTSSDSTATLQQDVASQSSPQYQLVSPIVSQHAPSFAPGYHPTSARTDSVSSIALANLHSQRATDRVASPQPPSFIPPTTSLPQDDVSKFSALGTGGPSDWETFGAGEEVDDEALFVKKNLDPNESRHDERVELPAHQPSPPSTQGWPSPANQTDPMHSDRHDTYQPTPPTATVSPVQRTPSPKTPQQRFFAKDALVAPAHAEAPREVHHGFVMGEVLWDVPKQIGNAMQQQQLPAPGEDTNIGPQGVQVPAPIQISHPTQTPASGSLVPPPQTSQENRPGVNRFYSDVGTTWGLSPKDREQASNPWGSKDDIDLPAKLQAKDQELWKLRRESKDEMQRVQAEIDAGKAEFLAEIERLKADEEAIKALAAKQALALGKQVEATQAAAEQAKLDADALKRENALTIERIKEDVEGKEDTIRERDVTIADLQQQVELLRGLLEEEKAKSVPAPPQPTALDLVPDLDPWYAGSLERYIAMLRGEANEPRVEDKIRAFKTFLKAESGIRGIEYEDLADQPASGHVALSTAEHDSSEPAVEQRHLNISVPQDSFEEDDYEYSPGGRPFLKRSKLPIEDKASTHIPFIPSSQSTAILTPTSSVHDELTLVQSSLDEQPQPQYKAYAPQNKPTNVPTSLAQRQVTKPPYVSTNASSTGPEKNRDEIFFGTHKPRGEQRISRSASSDGTGGVPIVAPLNIASSRPVSMSAPPRDNPLAVLIGLLPSQIDVVKASPAIEQLRKEAATISSGSNQFGELTMTWGKAASLTRKKNEEARRKRAEDSEAHNDDLFESDEISYAGLKDLEAALKENEDKLKTQEAQDECDSYVERVFDPIYSGVQANITALTDLYIKAETLLQTCASGVKSLGRSDLPTTKACLELLIEIHDQIETAHEQIVQAVAERDRIYKKTEIQSLYNTGNKNKMRSTESHFERAEKQAIHRAKNESAERMGELIKVAEEAVVSAASIEQSERSRIIAATRNLENVDDTSSGLLSRAQDTFLLLHQSSGSLLTIFNRLEIRLNIAEAESDIAQARADGAPEARIQELELEMHAQEKELRTELARRIGVLEQEREECEQLMKDKKGKSELNGEQDEETRLRMALEEAKRRNGHV